MDLADPAVLRRRFIWEWGAGFDANDVTRGTTFVAFDSNLASTPQLSSSPLWVVESRSLYHRFPHGVSYSL